jgi:hypothetical protein
MHRARRCTAPVYHPSTSETGYTRHPTWLGPKGKRNVGPGRHPARRAFRVNARGPDEPTGHRRNLAGRRKRGSWRAAYVPRFV